MYTDYTYSIAILIILFVGIVWLNFELRKTAKTFITEKDASPHFEISTLAVIILICIFVLPWLFTQTSFSINNFSQGTGVIGDTIGGITAPFINGISAILVYIAFKEQIKANEDQRKQFLKQSDENRLQSFQSFFFTMIENQYKLIDSVSFKFEISTSPESEHFEKNLIPNLEKKRSIKLEEVKGMACLNEFVSMLNKKIESSEDDIISQYSTLFFKHSSYLSHYIRNLFQFIKLIDEKELVVDDKIITFDDGEDEKLLRLEIEPLQKREVETKKYEYIRILRAQFSDAQLEIIALNSLTTQGNKFLFYVRKYRLIKNINEGNLPEKLTDYLSTNFPQLNHGS